MSRLTTVPKITIQKFHLKSRFSDKDLMRFRIRLSPGFLALAIFVAGGQVDVSRADSSGPLCVVKNLTSSLRNFANLYRGQLTAGMDARSFSIFEKLRNNPESVLSATEQSWLQEKHLDAALAQYRSSGKLVRGLNHLIALNRRARPLSWNSLSWKKKAFKWLTDFGTLGLPIDSRSNARRIFAKYIDDPNHTLGPWEKRFIEFYHLEDELARFREELALNQRGFLVLSGIRRVASKAKWGILGSTAVSAAALGQSEQKDLTVRQSFDSRHTDGLQPHGTVELILANDPMNPPILVVGAGTFIFNYAKVSLDVTEESETLKRLESDRKEHYRIRFRATPQQIEDLTQRLVKYVASEKKPPIYLDTPTGEVYRILRQEFGLPLLPVVNHLNGTLLDYFKILHIAENGKGPVKDIFRVGHSFDGKQTAREMGVDAWNTLLNGSFVLTMPLIDAGLAAYDQKSSTIKELK